MDYPGNSYSQNPRAEPPKPEAKKVEKVIRGEAIRRKKSPGKRFRELFFSGDAKSALGTIFTEVLVPRMKDTIQDVFEQGLANMLWGDDRSMRRRHGFRPSPYGYFDYSRPSRSMRDPRHEESRGLSRRARLSHDFDEIILETRAEATEVIDQLFELISRFNVATVADLYDLVGIESNYIDRKWGWEDIRGAGVSHIKGGYLLDLPRPDPLE
jgi:hypothetical protein